MNNALFIYFVFTKNPDQLFYRNEWYFSSLAITYTVYFSFDEKNDNKFSVVWKKTIHFLCFFHVLLIGEKYVCLLYNLHLILHFNPISSRCGDTSKLVSGGPAAPTPSLPSNLGINVDPTQSTENNGRITVQTYKT